MKLVHLLCPSLLLSLCGATEYYVRPTEPTDTSCPAQPCLTLSQYISNSDFYFKSNTVFKFLPGLHHTNQTMDMQSVENVSLKNEQEDTYPALMMHMDCSSHGCSGFYFGNIRNLTIHSLSITIYVKVLHLNNEESHAHGFKFVGVSNLQMYHIGMEFTSSSFQYSSGITVLECKNIFLHSLTTICGNHCRVIDVEDSDDFLVLNVSAAFGAYGYFVRDSRNITISDTEMVFTSSGIDLHSNIATNICNVVIKMSKGDGIVIKSSEYTRISNTVVSNSQEQGIRLRNCSNADIVNTSVFSPGSYGISLSHVHHVVVTNTSVSESFNDGIGVYTSTNITFSEISLMYIGVKNFSGEAQTGKKYIHNPYAIEYHGLHMVQVNSILLYKVRVIHFIVGIRIYSGVNITIKKTTVMPVGKGVSSKPAILIRKCNGCVLSKSVFTNFGYLHTVTKWLAVVAIEWNSDIHLSDCSFENNNTTALRVISSQITFSGILRFIGNRAEKGGAIIFGPGSTMKLSQNGNVFFVDNHAILYGGVIYLSNDDTFCVDESHPKCFLQLEQYDSDGRLTFVNNSAEKGGDAVYVSMMNTKLVSCFSVQFKNISHILPDTLSKVASDPYRVCICNNSTPECQMVNLTVDPIFPGQSFNVSAVVVGREGGTVAGLVFATFAPLYSIRPQLAAGEGTKGVTQLHCNELEYTIFSRSTNEQLVLTTVTAVSEYTDPIKFTEVPLFINITLLPCPPGFSLMKTSAKCDCSPILLQLPGVSCNIKDQTIHRSGLVWVGSVQDENQTVGNVITAKYCPLNYCKHEGISVHLNQPDTQCEFNRSGILCGGCRPGLSLMLGGVQCELCSNKNLSLIIPLLWAGVVLVFFLKISNLTTSEGFINSLVFYASIVKANEHIFLPQANTNPLTLFISWLNLDLGVQTCFFNGLSAYTKTWLQFVFPFYIWSITGVIIISARYSTRIARISGNNSVPVLATLFLLSYAKLLGVIITSLSYTVVEYPGGQKVVWSADGNIDYLGAKHALLFVAAVATLLFLWLPYTVLLFSGQWLYKCKLNLINRMLIKLKPFLDAHYGPLKDSHRYWFGALLLVRAVILLISALVIRNNFSVFIFSISIATNVLILALMAFSHIDIDLRAYRSKAVSFFEYSIFLNLLLLCLAKYHTSVGGGSEIAASYTLIGSVFVQFAGVLVFRIYFVVKNKVSRYFPMDDSKEEESVWRYENSIEMKTTQYRNANNML